MTTDIADELEVEYEYDSDDLVSDQEEVYSDDEDEEDSSPAPSRQDPRVVQLATDLEAANAKIADLNQRLGDAVRISGERLKQRDEEINEWLEKLPEWHESEARAAHDEGFAEGVASVEDRLLDLLQAEEQAEYLKSKRLNPTKPSPRPVAPLDLKRTTAPSDATEDVKGLVQQFTALGVPLDQIEQTSAESVVKSGGKWLADTKLANDERISALEARIEGKVREDSGATRVSSGAGGAPRVATSNDQKRLADIDSRLKVLRGRGDLNGATPLLKEKRDIEARLARARQQARRAV